MSTNSSHRRRARHSLRSAAASFVLIAAALLLLAAPAMASLEEVTEFGDTGPIGGSNGQSQLFHTNGAAVNYSGAGGVTPGTLYVARPGFTAFGEGGGEFKGLRVYGPQGEFLEELGSNGSALGVAVDQTTGDIYVLTGGAVRIYSPSGLLIAEFGEGGAPHETVAAGPGKFHGLQDSGIAVDDAGTVYVSDFDSVGGEARAMVFKPESPGDYEHYAYTGRGNDIAFSTFESPVHYDPTALSLDAAGHLYMAAQGEVGAIYEFDPSEPGSPICGYQVPSGGEQGMTVAPATGEVFYWTGKRRSEITQLAACNAEGKFTVKGGIALRKRAIEMNALAFDPAVPYSSTRLPGILYGFAADKLEGSGEFGDQAHTYGIIAAEAESQPPAVVAESVSTAGARTATLGAQINPHGFPTGYAFQYETQAQYEANHPDEIQELTLSATGGLFGLAAGQRRYGGPLTATLTAGSAVATAPVTAAGTATLSAAKGTATLKAAKGKGTVIAGSTAITALTTSEGPFEVGQTISGAGIPAGTTILAIPKSTELTISSPATSSAAGVALSAGLAKLTAVSASEGAFAIGQQIEGTGIAPNTKITAVFSGELFLSAPLTKPGTAVAIKAGSTVLTSLTTSEGSFEVGQQVKGTGIPSGATIESVAPGELTLSGPVTQPGSGVAISATPPEPLAVGQAIEGPGIPPGTTIESATPGAIVLTKPAETSGTAVHLFAGLPYDASAVEVREALASLPAIGVGNVSVSGGPGDETGSAPYQIEFDGALVNTDVEQVRATSLGLSGGSASATVTTTNQGGAGFAGAAEAPPGGGNLAAASEALAAAATLSGLAPDTAYRFRAVATSHCKAVAAQICEADGAPKAFHTFRDEAPGLPDHRAWELVSPPRKNGGEVFPAEPELFSHSCHYCKPAQVLTGRFPLQSAPDGEAVVYEGYSFSPEEGNGKFGEYISRRTASGWQTKNLTPPLMSSTGSAGYQAFDRDLSAGVLRQAVGPTLAAGAPSGYPDFYSQPTEEPLSLAPLLTAAPPSRNATEFVIEFGGGSADFSKLFFSANDALTGETPFAPAAADPPGPPPGSRHIPANLYQSAGGQLSLVNVLPGNTETVPGQFGGGTLVEASGNVNAPAIYNAISADGSRVFWSDESGQLYVREDAQRTREIADHTGKFLTASADGSKVLLDDGCLYDLASEACEDLTGGKGGFRGIVGQSDDLSHVYFVDTAVLTGGEENEYGASAQAGGNNLYAWTGGETRFVATLTASDVGGEIDGDAKANPTQRDAEASPDGRYLAFQSVAPLTGQDNTGLCKESVSGPGGTETFTQGPCIEVFLFDAASGRLSCPSCNPTGRSPLGPSYLRRIHGVPATSAQPRYMLDSGRLYFDSQDSLSPFDTNEGVEDVYQYEPQGVGSCGREGGCVSLISAGHEPVDSNLLTVDESGANVFFTTRDHLVQKDTDEAIDLYDAREGGGIAGESETQRGECQGESCQPAASPPNDATPASSSFHGAGNVAETKAHKSKKKHRKHKHERHHRRAHANRRAQR